MGITMLKFEFSEQMTRQIAEALENMPYRFAAPILAEMQKQISAQQKEKTAQGNGRESALPPRTDDLSASPDA
jgi:hypothetical protein